MATSFGGIKLRYGALICNIFSLIVPRCYFLFVYLADTTTTMPRINIALNYEALARLLIYSDLKGAIQSAN